MSHSDPSSGFSFARRARVDEWMDDFTIVDERLETALSNLRVVNRFLGGYAASLSVLGPYLTRIGRRPIRVLDVGTGRADFPEYLVTWAAARGLDVRVTAIDANPAVLAYAGPVLDRRLPPRLRARVELVEADALALPFEEGAFDVSLASLFLHHLDDAAAVRLLREMQRVSRDGLLVNDLHRHPVAYYSIRALAGLLPTSPMFAHDAPVSVLRAFQRPELVAFAQRAGLRGARLRWRWAFRWVLTTIPAAPAPKA